MKIVCMVLVLLCSAIQAFALEGGTGWRWNRLNETFHAGGDFRYRYESIDEEGLDLRYRQKIRLRGIFAARLSEQVSFITRIGTGQSDSPVSMNQALDDAFESKPVWIDVACVNWSPSTISGLDLFAGKVRNPFLDAGLLQLVWDIDVSPEGVAAKYSHAFPAAGIFLNAASFVVDERSKGGDVQLNGVQAGVIQNAAGFDITLSAGYQVFSGAKGSLPFYDSAGHGNTLDSGGNYACGFEEAELLADAAGTMGRLPARFYAHAVSNRAADDDNFGYGAGFTFGKAAVPGSFDFRYEYKYLERDSVVGFFTDSSFAGSATDGKRHKILLGYRYDEKVRLNLSYQHNTKGLDKGRMYHVVQFDVICWL